MVRSARLPYYNLENKLLDPYSWAKNRTQRISWNQLSDVDIFVDKSSIIDWFAQMRDYSEQTVQSILVDGILENNFHNISFIFRLTQRDDFCLMSSKAIYELLYHIVRTTPIGIQSWVDEADFSMSVDVLALLARKR